MSSEPTPTVSPAGSTTAAKTMTSSPALVGPLASDRRHAATGSWKPRVYVCGSPRTRRPTSGTRATCVGRRRRPGSPTGGGDRRGVPQRDRRRRPRPAPGEAATCRGDRWPSRRPTGSTATWRSSESSDPPMSPAAVTMSTRSSRSRPISSRTARQRYERNGSVYFRGADVASRAGLDRANAMELARQRGGHPDDPDKDDPLDAALWQRSAGGEPAWPSPWGPGRPGWHAECTAMSLATFGPTVDLHVGGRSRLPASRLRSGPGRGLHRSATLRTGMDARRQRARRREWPSPPAISCTCTTCSTDTRRARCGC